VTGGLRFKPARSAWEKGHIPRADFVDFSKELSDLEAEFEFMLPPAAQFAEVMQRHGVGEGTRVVLYDSLMSVWAARLWWMLRHYGFDEAAVLNGGLQKWKTEGRPLSTEVPQTPPGRFVARPSKESLFSDKHEVLRGIKDTKTCIVDALTPDYYSGANKAGIPGRRAGHIPSAANVPFAAVVDEEMHAYLPADQLSKQFAGLDLASGDRVITYCGAGIAASSVAFAMALLGRDNVAVYDGSLFEWAADPNLPMET
jgi:thiosulfate/3-mercaptopyruvate sulfurtransferase